MSFKFEKLKIWQKSMDFGEEVYSLIQTFPKLERFNLSSQLLRASDSIALTISEGWILQSKAEFNRHYLPAVALAARQACLFKPLAGRFTYYISSLVFSG